MIISPPFLPQGTYNSDDAFVEAAMVETNEGFYPVSGAFCWHNGIHLVNPDGTNQAPVCAIADGTVIYRQDPTPASQDPNHPQNYNPHSNDHPSWTDNGMVIIEHSTEIGATGTAPTTITYYSVYYHLSRLDANLPQVGKPIYRKMPLGQAGQIYGNLSHEIHFEICCNADNLQHITGRHAEPNALENKSQAPAQDGRTDSVFGSMYFYLPPDTPTVSGNQPTTSNAQTTPLNTPMWVRIAYGGTIIGQTSIDNGSVSLVSYSTDGNLIGDPVPEKDFEYNLYTEANKRHTQQPQISPCDWYDLLRFGRKLDGTAIPATVAHWRQIRTASGLVWANLNAANVKKFSDADFLPVMGWNFYQDDSDHHDQRCNSTDLQSLIRNPDASDEHRMEPEQLMQRIVSDTDSTRTNKLKRVIAKFSTEWDQTTIAQRCEWIKHEPEFDENPDNWTKLLNHVQGITCPDLPQAYKDALWHFNPKEFIKLFKQCGWLSAKELKQILPLHAIRKKGSHGSSHHAYWDSIVLDADRTGNINNGRFDLNRVLRRYCINTPSRQSCFFGNASEETQWLKYFREGNNSNPSLHNGWYGRGYLQLTNPNGNMNNGNNNYYNYFKFIGRSPNTPPAQQELSWRDEIGTSYLHAANSAGAYWIWDYGKHNANRYADQIKSDRNRRKRIDIYQAHDHNEDHDILSGQKTWYYNVSFAKCAASVNLPGAVANTTENHPPNSMNGLVDRSVAYVNALILLDDIPSFDDEHGNLSWVPEDFSPRRI